MRYRLRTLLMVLVVGGSVFADGPIDPPVMNALSDTIRHADAVVVARFIAPIREGGKKAVEAEYEVIEIIKAVGVEVKKGDRITAWYQDEKQGKKYLIGGLLTSTARVSWKRNQSLTKIQSP